MKIAICYSGMVRNLFDVIDSHKKYIFGMHDCDIFFHFWDILGKSKQGWRETDVDTTRLTIDEQISIVSLLNPKQYTFERFSTKETYFSELGNKLDEVPIDTNPKNVVSMYYSIQQAHINLLKHIQLTNTKYDAVIRIRPDILFSKTVNVCKPVENKIVVPKINSWPINDHFAIGTLNVMNIYAGIYSDMISVNKMKLHPESVLTNKLNRYNIKVQQDDSIKYKMIRVDDDGTKMYMGDD
jgi:hypothetical protein